MPNTLIYRTHEPAKVAEHLEERVRADLGAQMRVPYEVHDAREPGRAGALVDFGKLMVGANLDASIATIVFTLPWHRPATLGILATRFAISSLCANLLYEIDLIREVDGPIGFAKKAFTAEDETGARSASRLNATPGLSGRVNKILREHVMFGTLMVRQTPHFSIAPIEGGSRLLIRTLGHPSGLLIAKGSTDAGEVLAIAKAIEGAL